MQCIITLGQVQRKGSGFIDGDAVFDGIAGLGIDHEHLQGGQVGISVLGPDKPGYQVHPGIVRRVDVHVVQVMFSLTALFIPRLIACKPVVHGLKEEVIVRGIDGIPQVHRLTPASVFVFGGVEYIIATHVIVSVGAEEKGLAIHGDKGGLFVIPGVDGGAQVLGDSPFPVSLPPG